MTPNDLDRYRPELTPMPFRIRKLPVLRGYPVPWFVAKGPDGEYDFRFADAVKRGEALRRRLCWVCGELLGVRLCFVIGPMCAVNRTTAEPACHYDCAKWSAENCPFLVRPHMVRRENAIPDEVVPPSGESIQRNPGCTLLWSTRAYFPFADGKGGSLIEIGAPEHIEAYAEGKPTTFEVVEHSIDTGEPFLREACGKEETEERRMAAHEALSNVLPITKAFLKEMLASNKERVYQK